MSAGRSIMALGALALLAACGSDAPAAKAPESRPVLVALAAAQPASADGGLLASGTVRAKRETALAFVSAGRIAEVLVEDGQAVRRGQLLARLDMSAISAGGASARAEAARAQSELKRMEALADKGWVTRSRLESAQATAAAAQAQASARGFDERFARIYAPTDGVVLRRHVESNQIVTAGSPVITLGEARDGYVMRVPLPDADVPRVRIGQGAAVTIAALGDQPLAATITEVAARGDDRTGTFEIELALPNRAGLRSGLIGQARIRVAGRGDAVAIPASAIWQARADEGFVYVADRGVAKARMVQLGPVDDREVIVTGGLTAGEQVVRSGVERLRDGVKITTRKAS
ncbi:efflux RND transporter periplasmic adaptor subunit [Sphingoaurantiacus capsulatus]|uniref:Efflux RND transporter periplasmic adaptor subunit n=1 Tax=Sphingoaurantiacus capsulatus TaxID=1771310 RepID=A0ABV7XBU3_9SPHN